MNRKCTGDSLRELVAKLRREIPGITLRTTFITGFPGETEEQFNELGEFAEEMRFERMGCFAYSEEEGTPAASFPDMVDEEVREHRIPSVNSPAPTIGAVTTSSCVARVTVFVSPPWSR